MESLCVLLGEIDGREGVPGKKDTFTKGSGMAVGLAIGLERCLRAMRFLLSYLRTCPEAPPCSAANHLYNVRKPDGLTIGTCERGLLLAQLTKVEGVKFDLIRVSWVGSAGIIPNLFVIRSDLPYNSFAELIKTKDTIYMGTAEARGMATQFPTLLKVFLKVNLEIVPGYSFHFGRDIGHSTERSRWRFGESQHNGTFHRPGSSSTCDSRQSLYS